MATSYQHRAYDPSGQAYVYWLSSLKYDSAGIDYIGPPAFGTLTGVSVIKSYEISDPALVFMPIEETTLENLNEFDVVT